MQPAKVSFAPLYRLVETQLFPDNGSQPFGQQGFMDPAIMSMRMSEAANGFQHAAVRQSAMMEQSRFGPPPGLVNIPPPGLQRQVAENKMVNGHIPINGQLRESNLLARSNGQVPARERLAWMGRLHHGDVH